MVTATLFVFSWPRRGEHRGTSSVITRKARIEQDFMPINLTWERLGLFRGSHHMPGKSGGLNGSTQHFPEVYSQESENLKFVVGVDLSAALLCSDPTGNSRLGLRSSGSIVVRARLCFRSSRVARDSADHRSRLSHAWPP